MDNRKLAIFTRLVWSNVKFRWELNLTETLLFCAQHDRTKIEFDGNSGYLHARISNVIFLGSSYWAESVGGGADKFPTSKMNNMWRFFLAKLQQSVIFIWSFNSFGEQKIEAEKWKENQHKSPCLIWASHMLLVLKYLSKKSNLKLECQFILETFSILHKWFGQRKETSSNHKDVKLLCVAIQFFLCNVSVFSLFPFDHINISNRKGSSTRRSRKAPENF